MPGSAAPTVTRAEWGARPARCATALPVEQTRGIAVHYSGTAAETGRDGAAVMRSHQAYHQDMKGWCDVAYSFEVDARGVVYEGRGWNVRTAANGTTAANSAFYAVCFQGADKEGREDFTRAAQNALAALFREYRQIAGRWPDVLPHSAFTATACPGDEIRAWIALEPWTVEDRPWPLPVPAWFWRWNAWRLGEGSFRLHGPRNRAVRHLTGAPRVVPPWAWARAVAFDRARKRR